MIASVHIHSQLVAILSAQPPQLAHLLIQSHLSVSTQYSCVLWVQQLVTMCLVETSSGSALSYVCVTLSTFLLQAHVPTQHHPGHPVDQDNYVLPAAISTLAVLLVVVLIAIFVVIICIITHRHKTRKSTCGMCELCAVNWMLYMKYNNIIVSSVVH